MVDALSPTLEMLWESGDPGDALRSRFGFGSTDAVVEWVVSALGELWGVQVASCERVVISDSNALAWVGTSVGRMIAKWSVAPERFARLAALARLTAWLAKVGLPVSAPVPTLSGEVQVERDAVSLGLQREIAGDYLDTRDPCQVRAAGASLARLHDALANYPDAVGFPAPGAPTVSLADRVNGWLDSASEHTPRLARDALRRLVEDMPRSELSVQLVHGDFRSANLLCHRREVAAVIDFEEVRFDHCVVELGRAAVMLGTRFRDWGPVSSEVHSQLLDGYQSVQRLGPTEVAWWPVLVLWSSQVMVPAGGDPTGWAVAAQTVARDLELDR